MYTIAEKPVKSVPKPRLMFSHATEDGSGSAFQVELHPATLERPGSIMLEFANQTDSGYCDVDGYHTGGFVWQDSLKFRIKLPTIGKLLRVLDGKVEQMNPSTSEPVQVHRKGDTVFLWCDREPEEQNYGETVLLTAIVDNSEKRTFRLNPEEVEVLRLAIGGAMTRLAWGNEFGFAER